VVAPWSRSANGTAPTASSATLPNGSANTAALNAPALSSAGMAGNPFFAMTKRTSLGGIPCSVSSDAASRYRMFFGALTAIVRPFSSPRVLIREPGIV